MSKPRHWALSAKGFAEGSDLISRLLKGEGPPPFEVLKGKKGALFSVSTLNHFIKEEAFHDDHSLSNGTDRSIRTFSSGEQRKALLEHLLSTHPDYIILDNVFDMLDKGSRDTLLNRLELLSERISFLQIFTRSAHIFPFADTVLCMRGDKIEFEGSIEVYRSRYRTATNSMSEMSIPPPLYPVMKVPNPLIRLKNVTVNYRETRILNQINWKIQRGDFWQLTGPNGSGKTTLLTMITGDNPKGYGQDLHLFGYQKGSGESVWDIKKHIGYITPSMTVLFNGRHTVENMVISGLHDSIGLYQYPTYSERVLAGQWIDLIGMGPKKQKYFSQISEGEQCMVLIARAMIKHPPLLILDEPSHGLGDEHVLLLTSLINKIAKESLSAIIYVSHQKEKGLEPDHIFELLSGPGGSTGQVATQHGQE